MKYVICFFCKISKFFAGDFCPWKNLQALSNIKEVCFLISFLYTSNIYESINGKSEIDFWVFRSIFRHCEAGASDLTPSLVRPSIPVRLSLVLPSKILKIEFPTCHVSAMALKTGLFVHRWTFVLYASTNGTYVTVQL